MPVKSVPRPAREVAEDKLADGTRAVEVEENKRATQLEELHKKQMKGNLSKRLVHERRPMKLNKEEERLQFLKQEEGWDRNTRNEDDRLDLQPPPLPGGLWGST